MKAGICADTIECARNHKSRKQHEERGGDNDANQLVGNYPTTTHTGPHDQRRTL